MDLPDFTVSNFTAHSINPKNVKNMWTRYWLIHLSLPSGEK